MKTKKIVVDQDISVWAFPNGAVGEGEELFTYEIATFSEGHWRNGAICLHTTPITIEVPAGIDVRKMAIETLEQAKKDLATKCYEETLIVQRQINRLRYIEYVQE